MLHAAYTSFVDFTHEAIIIGSLWGKGRASPFAAMILVFDVQLELYEAWGSLEQLTQWMLVYDNLKPALQSGHGRSLDV